LKYKSSKKEFVLIQMSCVRVREIFPKVLMDKRRMKKCAEGIPRTEEGDRGV
jgi:hypothetical protein